MITELKIGNKKSNLMFHVPNVYIYLKPKIYQTDLKVTCIINNILHIE